MIRFTNRRSDFATPIWLTPTALDNSGESISVVLRTGFEPGTSVGDGSYEIVYDVSDSAGNAATPCRFTVDIRGTSITAAQRKNSPDGRQHQKRFSQLHTSNMRSVFIQCIRYVKWQKLSHFLLSCHLSTDLQHTLLDDVMSRWLRVGKRMFVLM